MFANTGHKNSTPISSSLELVGVIFAILIFMLLTAQTVYGQTPVKAQPLSELTITLNRSVPATTLSLHETTVSSQLSANISTLPVLVGDTLEAGEAAGTLDCVDTDLLLQQAKAQLVELTASKKLIKQQLDRLEKLRQNKNASEEQINQKQTEMSVSNARIGAQSIVIKQAQRQASKCQILTPFAGVVTEVQGKVGSFVTMGTPIFSLVDPQSIELEAAITIDQMAQIENHELLFFLFDSETYPVKPRTILPIIEPRSQTRKARLIFLDEKPIAGAHGRLQWTITGNILPASLIVERNNEAGVFIVDTSDSEKSVAKFHVIKHAEPSKPTVVDLDSTTMIITDGRFSLIGGQEIILK